MCEGRLSDVRAVDGRVRPPRRGECGVLRLDIEREPRRGKEGNESPVLTAEVGAAPVGEVDMWVAANWRINARLGAIVVFVNCDPIEHPNSVAGGFIARQTLALPIASSRHFELVRLANRTVTVLDFAVVNAMRLQFEPCQMYTHCAPVSE